MPFSKRYQKRQQLVDGTYFPVARSRHIFNYMFNDSYMNKLLSFARSRCSLIHALASSIQFKMADAEENRSRRKDSKNSHVEKVNLVFTTYLAKAKVRNKLA